jgi:hypothetical protein
VKENFKNVFKQISGQPMPLFFCINNTNNTR